MAYYLVSGAEPKPLLYREYNNPNGVLLDHLEKTLLYALTNYTPYAVSSPLSALMITNPEETQPPGCIMRFIAFVNNPGSSICQVEVRHEKNTKNYNFYINSAKIGETTFSEDFFVLGHRVFLIFSIIEKMLVLSPLHRSDSSKRNHDYNFQEFQKVTNITKFEDNNWTYFDILLHHCVFLASCMPRERVYMYGYYLHWEEGDHLTIGSADYGSSYRAAVSDFMDGSKHSRTCFSISCILCLKRTAIHILPLDVCNIIIEYALDGDRLKQSKPYL